MGLVFSISIFFITRTSLANKWMRKKYLFAVILALALMQTMILEQKKNDALLQNLQQIL
mgnify:CR=1 FL=1